MALALGADWAINFNGLGWIMRAKVFPVNDAGDPEEITVDTFANKVTVFEGPDPDNVAAWTGPTTAWLFRLIGSDKYTFRDIGASYVFEKGGAFSPGKIADIKTASGATFFYQVEM